ncbi:MAG: hypothetical protein AB7S26_17865 [Sandaracinaceae bacterium]
MKHIAFTCLAALTLVPIGASIARADAPTVDVTLAPWASRDGTDRPYRYVVGLDARADGELEVLTDRRAISFEVRATEGRRARRYTCRHPRTPRTSERGEHRRAAREVSWTEWVDVRMYCTGRALSALEGGAELTLVYGWRRPSRTRWTARLAPETGRRARVSVRDAVGGASSAALTVAPRESASGTVRVGATDETLGPAPIRVELSSRTARSERGLTFRVAVRAVEGTERLYVRPDAYGFIVVTPTRTVRCRVARGGGRPPADLFTRATTRSGPVSLLDVSYFCPDDTFREAGLYEVRPKLRLDHSGEEWSLHAVTGRFLGPPATIRILSSPDGYTPQTVPERAGDAS